MTARTIVAVALIAVLGPFASAPVSAADIRILNSLLDSAYAQHVVDGYVDYPAMARNARFYKYIEAIAEFDVEALATDEERLAFWINAYNACAIKSVIDGVRPMGSMGRLKFFRTTEHRIAGRDRDLRSIEHGIIPDFEEPLAYMALVGASYSSPKLRSEAYTAEKLAVQLRDNARDFINDNRKNRFSDAARKAKLSEIFDWHSDVFGDDDEAVLAWVADYLDDEVKATALREARYKIEYMKFEWGINGRPL